MTALDTWHKVIANKDPELLSELLADDVVFYSPVVFKPQRGKELTTMYLSAAVMVLGNDSFRYVREIVGTDSAMLEFEVEVDGKYINGIDLIRWNPDQQISEFKVMIRPLQAVNLLHAKMGELVA